MKLDENTTYTPDVIIPLAEVRFSVMTQVSGILTDKLIAANQTRLGVTIEYIPALQVVRVDTDAKPACLVPMCNVLNMVTSEDGAAGVAKSKAVKEAKEKLAADQEHRAQARSRKVAEDREASELEIKRARATEQAAIEKSEAARLAPPPRVVPPKPPAKKSKKKKSKKKKKK